MKKRILNTSYFMSIACLFVSSIFKIQHWPGAGMLFSIYAALALIFIVVATSEIFRSRRDVTEKLMWTIGLIFMYPVISIVYMLSGRKFIIESKRINEELILTGNKERRF